MNSQQQVTPLDSHRNDVTIRLFRKNGRSGLVGQPGISRTIRIVQQEIAGETTSTFLTPENTIEVQAQYHFRTFTNSIVFGFKPSKDLIEGHILVQSAFWLGGTIFSIYFPSDQRLERGLTLTIQAARADIYSTVIYKAPDLTRHGTAQCHIGSNKSRDVRPEIVECRLGACPAVHVFHLRTITERGLGRDDNCNPGIVGSAGPSTSGLQQISGNREGSTSRGGEDRPSETRIRVRADLYTPSSEVNPVSDRNAFGELRRFYNTFTVPTYANTPEPSGPTPGPSSHNAGISRPDSAPTGSNGRTSTESTNCHSRESANLETNLGCIGECDEQCGSGYCVGGEFNNSSH